MFLDFIVNNISELSTILISFVATTLPIPLIIRQLTNKYHIATKSNPKAKKDLVFSYDKDPKVLLKYNTDIEKNTINPSKSSNSSPANNLPEETTYLPKKTALFELYEKRNTDKFLKKTSFILAVIMSIIGTIILFAGILITLFTDKDILWVTTSSGAIIELVAGIYFWLLNRTMKEVNNNSKKLEQAEDLLTAIELVGKISNISVKDETYKNMIDKLLSKEK